LSIYFLDTSALGRRYLKEVGSVWINALIEPEAGNTIIVSELAVVEVTSILARRHRDGAISRLEFSNIRADFLLHIDTEYKVILLNSMVVALASDLFIRHPLRSLDALQLASAIASSRGLGFQPIFLSADNRLLAAAGAEGFPVDNPYNHP
jgi:hypothetical protein